MSSDDVNHDDAYQTALSQFIQSLEFETTSNYNLSLSPEYNVENSIHVPLIPWGDAKVMGRKWYGESREFLEFSVSWYDDEAQTARREWLLFRANTKQSQLAIDTFLAKWKKHLEKLANSVNSNYKALYKAARQQIVEAESVLHQPAVSGAAQKRARAQNNGGDGDDGEDSTDDITDRANARAKRQRTNGQPADDEEEELAQIDNNDNHDEDNEEEQPKQKRGRSTATNTPTKKAAAATTRSNSKSKKSTTTPKKDNKKNKVEDEGEDEEEEEEQADAWGKLDKKQTKTKHQNGYIVEVYKDEYEPEEILAHKKDPKLVYLFQVRWVGYPLPADYTFEPPAHLKNYVDLVYSYCRDANCLDVFAASFPADPRSKTIAKKRPSKK